MSTESNISELKGHVEEFRALRQEMMYALSSRVWGIASYLVISGALFAFWARVHLAEVYLAPIILAIPFILYTTYLERIRIRIHTYIEVFLESSLPGLAWEQYLERWRRHVRENSLLERKFDGWRYVFAVVGVYDTTSAICLYFAVSQSDQVWVWVVGSIALVIVLLGTVWFHRILKATSYYREIWESFKSSGDMPKQNRY